MRERERERERETEGERDSMFLFVCLYVWMCLCMCVCVYVCLSECVCKFRSGGSTAEIPVFRVASVRDGTAAADLSGAGAARSHQDRTPGTHTGGCGDARG